MKPIVMISIFAAGGISMVIASSIISGISQKPEMNIGPGNFELAQSSNANYIRVIKTDKVVDETKDPIWKVELVVNGEVLDSVDALIGRSYRQTVSRDIAGSKSPLPIGTYSIDRSGVAKAPFDDPELGKGYWVPITPLFSTGRSALGIHQDPSWGKKNGESGTSGCIGLKTVEDTKKIESWIHQYNLQTLKVQS